ncbi:hypothetical protein [Flavimobilis rhizosphaerae]|nr:hypothetical protein [Flavimobilis rhizosphaerae]
MSLSQSDPTTTSTSAPDPLTLDFSSAGPSLAEVLEGIISVPES